MKAILCLDGGSSSLKYAAYRLSERGDDLEPMAAAQAAASSDASEALTQALAQLGLDTAKSFVAVGHRIVFGGPRLVEPTRADTNVLHELEGFVAIEPLHLRAELDLVYAAQRCLPSAVQVLCFDTAFHRRSPAIAKKLPLPRDIDPLIERYGFHGLSYEYVLSTLPHNAKRTVIAHLGSGASLCAVDNGAPVDSTMGFSTLGGLMMGTRPGDLDPGVLLRLLQDGYDLESLSDFLYRRCGLIGVSAGCADMKALLDKAGANAQAREAVELFVYQLVKHLGSMIAVLGGLERLVFTGGIGENAPAIRAAACLPLRYLGVSLDEAANAQNARIISAADSLVPVMVVPTNENLAIARHTARLLQPSIEKGL